VDFAYGLAGAGALLGLQVACMLGIRYALKNPANQKRIVHEVMKMTGKQRK
jgi:hypothetical protein